MEQSIINSTTDITLYSEDEKKNIIWSRAFEAWLTNIKSKNTRRAYCESWKYFISYLQCPPWRIGRSMVVEFINDMRKRGLADGTVQQRLCALSSFFDFVNRDYTVINEQGREIPLYDINPASSKILRARLGRYEKATWLTKDEVKLFLNSIDKNTVQGKRDYALFLTFFFTGRRNTELRNLKWGDMWIEDDGRILYKWSGKYVETKNQEMPLPCYDAILSYLKYANRFENIQKEDFIFVSVNHNAERLPNVGDKYNPNNLLSMREIGKLLKKYLKLAGIEKPLTCHGLRHTATVLRRSVGDDIEVVSNFLGHVRIITTETYLHIIEGTKDKSWGKVETLLDL
jgi:integrase/recombinase XerD